MPTFRGIKKKPLGNADLIKNGYCQGNNEKIPWEMMIWFKTPTAWGVNGETPWKMMT